jgi:molybdopterin converting factor small subunit
MINVPTGICTLVIDILNVVNYGYSAYHQQASGAKMDTVRVNFYTWAADTLREGAPGDEVTLDLPLPSQGTLQSLLEGLAEYYPLFSQEVYDVVSHQITPSVTLFLNGRSIVSGQAQPMKLKTGDLLAFVPIAEGG